ncbi:FecR domain-containing protein [Pedobacter sp. MC2016-14]|uniref:FecR family protein n=1 Tax=Pedobacter sp. MC2016-14 TaxID=2897327 RepID=UPI001E52ED3B|nr:FecR domain-containing protein [Pedobacter sp. MC2016-14]MCD0489213.1 FecR domain-containing protein [Pedobacter sp. MC2016-14]
MKIEILIRYLNGETSNEENQQIEDWRLQDSSHQMELETLQLVWNSAATDKDYTPPNSVASLAKFKEKAGLTGQAVKAPYKSFNWKTWLKVAAILAPFPLLIWFFVLQYQADATFISAQTTVKTDTTLLADGSVVVLNRNSVLEYQEKFHDTRTVSLKKGEAFFKVKHDHNRPFIVQVNGIRIRVLGTSFNVKMVAGKTEVIVETGKVEISSKHKKIELSPSESVYIDKENQNLTKQVHPDQLYTYYRSKEFKAIGTPLWRLAEVLQEAYDVKILIPRNEVKNLPLSTTFKEEDLDDILAVIAKTFNITVNRNGNHIILN